MLIADVSKPLGGLFNVPDLGETGFSEIEDIFGSMGCNFTVQH